MMRLPYTTTHDTQPYTIHNHMQTHVWHTHHALPPTTHTHRFQADKRRGCQSFRLPNPTWARYVALRFLTQHTSEHICAVSELGVFGKTATQDLEDQLQVSSDQLQVSSEEPTAGVGHPATLGGGGTGSTGDRGGIGGGEVVGGGVQNAGVKNAKEGGEVGDGERVLRNDVVHQGDAPVVTAATTTMTTSAVTTPQQQQQQDDAQHHATANDSSRNAPAGETGSTNHAAVDDTSTAQAVPAAHHDTPRMKPPPAAAVPPAHEPVGNQQAHPQPVVAPRTPTVPVGPVTTTTTKEAPLPSGGTSGPSSMYDRLIQQLKEMKVQQAKLQAAHDELQEVTGARIDALVHSNAALVKQLQEMQQLMGELVGQVQRAGGARQGGTSFVGLLMSKWLGGADGPGNTTIHDNKQ